MSTSAALVGREQERAELLAALRACTEGRGGVVLIGGEAGVGKTRLAGDACAEAGLLVLNGEASEQVTLPYAPIVAALRAYLRHDPHGLDDCGPLRPYLSLLIPELGPPPASADGATVLEALRAAFATLSAPQPVAVVLDDLHWADHATLTDAVPMLARSLADACVLIVGIYRTDEIPRGHAVRRLRRELRRSGLLRELVLEPLDGDGTALLAAHVLGEKPSRALAATLYDRSQGVPFFVEELAGALISSDRLRFGRRGLEVADAADLPIPDTVRDAILLRTAQLGDDARAALEVAATAGVRFDLDLVAADGDALADAFEAGILRELEPGRAGFRHALTREAVYSDIPWSRRRALHRLLAERLEARAASSALVAEHWFGAHDEERACPALVASADQHASVYAYRDALNAAKRAAEIWPEGRDPNGRAALFERMGRSAALCGELHDAVTAWREALETRSASGDPVGAAEAGRELATVYELQGDAARALAARQDAATAFARADRHGEAAAELLSAASHLDSAGSLRAALELVEQAREHALRAGRRDLEVRLLGVEGTVRAKLGELDAGLAAARAGLELALAEDITGSAADAYQRLANVFEQGSDYRAAWETYQAAFSFCEARGAKAAAQVCLVCLGAILFFTGRWEEAIELDKAILVSDDASTGVRMGAKQQLGLIGAARGEPKRSRRLLAESGAHAARFERQRMEVWDAVGHGWLDELDGQLELAAERCRFVLERWGASESLHYPVPALRWATTFLATHGAEADARACAAALASLAAATANPEARAALAHAIGEVALVDGDPDSAVEQFANALGLLRELELPFEAAQTQLRLGVALAAAGERAGAVDQLTGAYRTARKLGARPLSTKVAKELAALGEPVERRLGRRAAAQLDGHGLSRRELEVVRLVSVGRTNREIAHELFVSTRTIDMHVRNIFSKLGCRSRAEAAHKAGELGLIA